MLLLLIEPTSMSKLVASFFFTFQVYPKSLRLRLQANISRHDVQSAKSRRSAVMSEIVDNISETIDLTIEESGNIEVDDMLNAVVRIVNAY